MLKNVVEIVLMITYLMSKSYQPKAGSTKKTTSLNQRSYALNRSYSALFFSFKVSYFIGLCPFFAEYFKAYLTV